MNAKQITKLLDGTNGFAIRILVNMAAEMNEQEFNAMMRDISHAIYDVSENHLDNFNSYYKQ